MSTSKITPQRRETINNLVLKILDDCELHSLPIDLIDILNHYKIILLNTKQAEEFGLLDKAYYDFNGKIVFINDFIFILYNERHPTGRIHWNISCFLAYWFLGHKECNETNEAEANYFTRQLLVPLPVLDYMNVSTVGQISKTCKISNKAAKFTLEPLEKYRNDKNKHGLTEYDIALLKQFGKYEFSKELAM